eukprot:gene11419-15303_t
MIRSSTKRKIYQPIPNKYKDLVLDNTANESYSNHLLNTPIPLISIDDQHKQLFTAKIDDIDKQDDTDTSVVGWGWNANGRAGNVIGVEIRTPKQVQKSSHETFIDCATGKHHSLLVSNEGMVYSFGEGRLGQLGYGNLFNIPLTKGGIIQAIPHRVTPSGSYKSKKDIKISQVACGGSFSIAREVSCLEGVSLYKGFTLLESTLLKLQEVYGNDCEILLKIKAYIKQEKCFISKVSAGNLTVWGTGKFGELGLGKYELFTPYPQIIPKLSKINIVRISSGQYHNLAIDSSGCLYSWGRNQSGQLGHGDYIDRYTPEKVLFFDTLYVEWCSGGDAHSGVLTTTRDADRFSQLKRVATFGRGAHGRLGHGTNRGAAVPVLVSALLPSLADVQYHQIECGGAHTIALVSKDVKKGLANPWGVETFVIGWGYGKNGQLGDGSCEDSFVPIKARMPKCVVISEISAGRSWSMAKSIGGILYTWGKGGL